MTDPTQTPTPWSIPEAWALPPRTPSANPTPRRGEDNDASRCPVADAVPRLYVAPVVAAPLARRG